MNEDRSARYNRLKRRAGILSSLAGAAWLAVLLAAGGSAWLADRAAAVSRSFPSPLDRAAAVVLCVVVVAVGWELVSLPFAVYRSFHLERKYGLSSEPLATWVGDHLKAFAIGLLFVTGAGLVVYGTIDLAGRYWWVAAAAIFTVATIGISQIAPVVLMPIFYRFKPLDRESLCERLLALSQRAGVPVLGAFEWGLGEKTTRANAALVGAGRTRRIILSDTLLNHYSDDEIEVILAHEMAHHVYHDIWSALALETLVVAAALYAADAAVTFAGSVAGVSTPRDLAALPLMILAGGLVSLLLTPVSNAWSRHNERRADRFALTLTGRPAAFITAMRRLGAQNLAEASPSAPVFWFFHTHPTIEERIAAAREFNVAVRA
jgi:Zn-dependent protease with chaperone function